MKWKNLGFALVALVLPSSGLLGSDRSNPPSQPAAWRTTPGSELHADGGLETADLRRLPLGEEPSRQTVEGRGFSPQRWPGSVWAPSWNAAGDAVDEPSGTRPFSEVPAALPYSEGLSERLGRDSVFLKRVQDGSGDVAPASCTEPLTGSADGLSPLPYAPPDPPYGLVRFTQPEPLAEPDEMDYRLLGESGDSAVDAPFVTYCVPPYSPLVAARLGWWFVEAEGSPTKVAEYQGLESSAFADLDGLFSDGRRTVNVSGSLLDNETGQAGLDYFGPGLSADFNLQRYLHRLDHDPLTNMGDMQSGQETIREDLNVGEDYAIRVEDVKASFESRLSEHVKARLNYRSLRKFGERQANAMQHCFCEIQQNNCHVLSQRQEIDWPTVKIEPVIEAKYGPVRSEYSRPMRFLNQDDQAVTRRFYLFGPHFRTERDYDFVPENLTQIDRLKLGVDLAAQTDFYARLSAGDTHNRFRDTHRKFQVSTWGSSLGNKISCSIQLE